MRELNTTELVQVSGSGARCEKGNNGWGNGGDDGIPSNRGTEDYPDTFKVEGDSSGAFGIHGGGRAKCAR